MTLDDLITNITPLYNDYRRSRGSTAVEQIILMWKLGDLLKLYIDENDVLPHALYRKIYGKSESTRNMTQKSYITREHLSRSYRVRRMFERQDDIHERFPGLTQFSHFREAMPFFDNPKYKLADKEMKELLQVLNSRDSDSKKTAYVKRLQQTKIGIKNPRTQRLDEMQEDKEIFIDFYNKVYKVIKEENFEDSSDILQTPEDSFVRMLAQNTGALSADGLKMSNIEMPDTIIKLWRDYAALVSKLVEKESSVERRRFRRLIPPEKMLRLSEMLYALVDEQSFNSLKTK